jgi:serine/threonine protein kinase
MEPVPDGCPPEAQLKAFHAGELADADCERVANHLATCGKCAELFGRLTAPYHLARLRDDLGGEDDLEGRVRVACDRLARDHDDGELRALLEEHTGYRVGVLLGSGGMGRVYAGTGKDGSGRVALKVILPRFAGVRSYLARFDAEAETLRNLDHRRVVRYLKLVRVGGCPVLVMEYVTGESLQDILRRGRLTPDEAVRHIVQLLEALQYLAGFGVVHRDVKPGNCLVTETGELKLVDFGIAKDLTTNAELTATGHIVGTPAYMSPEQAARPREVDSRSDLYSAGCVLYELLTGSPPFRGEAAAVIGAHATQQPVPPRSLNPAVPRAVSRATLRLLAKSPADRFQTAQDTLAALAPYAGDARHPRPTRRRAIVAAVIGLTALATIAVAALRDDEVPSPSSGDDPNGDGDELTARDDQTFWFGSESWKDYELSVDAMLVAGQGCPAVYFHASVGGYSRLRLGLRNGGFLCFEELVGGKQQQRSELFTFPIEAGKWVRVTVAVQPFAATCTISGNQNLTTTVRLARSQGRVGLGAEPGGTCKFRNLVVRDKSGAIIWSGFRG